MMQNDENDEIVRAYGQLQFPDCIYYISAWSLTVGRQVKRDDFVDINLAFKAISRKHLAIYYHFDALTWQLVVLGRNGAFVNDRHMETGDSIPLADQDIITIGNYDVRFVLPEGAPVPERPPGFINPFENNERSSLVVDPLTSEQNTAAVSDLAKPNEPLSTTPIAPRDLMQKSPSKSGTTVKESKERAAAGPVQQNATPDTLSEQGLPVKKNTQAKQAAPNMTAQPAVKIEVDQAKATSAAIPPNPWSVNVSRSASVDAQKFKVDVPMTSIETPQPQAMTDEERRLQEEEAAAQAAAQQLQQERIARQAREEEEGLILPPEETDPAVIAAFQKPSASYATMIYNAITSHDKKKMTLAQIYSWININHPYYRYCQNGWQNSIRHNLSLNKAFIKVPRTDDEPGKGFFWAVEPESEMLFEGGIYKKKPPRPTPTATTARGAPVVMKDGKLALNPNYFASGIQGKAEEVLEMLEAAVQRQLGFGNHEEEASRLARILALALATQLRQSAVAANNLRNQTSAVAAQRNITTTMPRYTGNQNPMTQRLATPNPAARPGPANGLMAQRAPGSMPIAGRPVTGQTGHANTNFAPGSTASTPYNVPSAGGPGAAAKPGALTAGKAGLTQAPIYYKPYQPYQPANNSLARSQAAANTSVKPGLTPGNGRPGVPGGTAIGAVSSGATKINPSAQTLADRVAAAVRPPGSLNPGSVTPTIKGPQASPSPVNVTSAPNKPQAVTASVSATAAAAASSPAATGDPAAASQTKVSPYPTNSTLAAKYTPKTLGHVPGPVTYSRTPLPGSTPVVYNRTPLPQSGPPAAYKAAATQKSTPGKTAGAPNHVAAQRAAASSNATKTPQASVPGIMTTQQSLVAPGKAATLSAIRINQQPQHTGPQKIVQAGTGVVTAQQQQTDAQTPAQATHQQQNRSQKPAQAAGNAQQQQQQQQVGAQKPVQAAGTRVATGPTSTIAGTQSATSPASSTASTQSRVQTASVQNATTVSPEISSHANGIRRALNPPSTASGPARPIAVPSSGSSSAASVRQVAAVPAASAAAVSVQPAAATPSGPPTSGLARPMSSTPSASTSLASSKSLASPTVPAQSKALAHTETNVINGNNSVHTEPSNVINANNKRILDDSTSHNLTKMQKSESAATTTFTQ